MTTTSSRTRSLRRATTILIAVLAAMAAWTLAVPLLGTALLVDQGNGPQPVRLSLVGLAPIVAGLTGWGLLALLERLFADRGRMTWRIVAVVVMTLSLYSPITMGLSVTSIGWLVALHVLVGLILIVGFSVLIPSSERGSKINTANAG